MSRHVEPGNIFKRTVGIKMEDRSEELANSLQYEEVLEIDKDGNLIVKKVY